MALARRLARLLGLAVFLLFWIQPAVGRLGGPSDEADEFRTPPAAARPWVYWFWKNGHITSQGITADLEAMQRVGIGGVVLMEVALSTPPGPVPFFSDSWRALFRHAVQEAERLGLQIAINSAPGWTGSGGPWVTPEQSMQKVVASETQATGPGQFDSRLAQPETILGWYQDIAVLAFPTLASEYRLEDIAEKALYVRGAYSSQPGIRPAFPAAAGYAAVPPEQRIPAGEILDLSDKMDATGRLRWDVPAGRWTILRFGHTSTGQTNRPAPSPGLECDKLDPAALAAHFKQFTGRLVNDVGTSAGRTLVATHLDSWEVGGQNWTGRFREEFSRRRGYDLLRYLPVMTGRVVESAEISERFLFDLRQTVSDMIAEYHGRAMRELARQHGLWLSIEPYDMTPCDNMTLGAAADVPMCEFWSDTFDTRYSVKEATSVAHVTGKPVVAAEAFTSTESWLLHPARLKSLGDWAFCEGVNRFVIHRYVHQPYPQIRPGFSLGPHGVHYERTQTWWELTRPWHEYLARCQYLLQQGHAVADVLYLSPEGAPNVFQRPEPEPAGYHYDACTPEALLTRLKVHDGKLVLPNGPTYQLLVLPDSSAMTPQLLVKIQQLVAAGASVMGPPPRKSPSLSGYPHCDAEVEKVADELWKSGKVHPWKRADDEQPECPLPVALHANARWIWVSGGNPAAASPVGKRFFRRVVTLETDRAIEWARATITADNSFELFVNGRSVGNGDSFRRLYAVDLTSWVKPGTNILAVAAENGGETPNPAALIATVMIQYAGGEQAVVNTDGNWLSAESVGGGWASEAHDNGWSAVVELGPPGTAPWGAPTPIEPKRRVYPDSKRIAELLQRSGLAPDFTADQPLRFAHRRIGETDLWFVSHGGTGSVESTCTFRITGKQPELWHPETGTRRDLPSYSFTADGRTVVPLRFENQESYVVAFRREVPMDRSATSLNRNFATWRSVADVGGPWHVSFDPRLGGPEAPLRFEQLQDWRRRPEEGVRYYSGTASYRTTFRRPGRSALSDSRSPAFLDLGVVRELAQVRLNGQDVGIVWREPFRVEITEALREGNNELEIQVTNLWPNRMIGDERLPPDSDRNPGGTLRTWPQWVLEGKSSPTGRLSFATWQSYKRESPLLESGLLGPVRLVVAQFPSDL